MRARVLFAAIFWCAVVLSAPTTGPILQLPSYTLPSPPASTDVADLDIAQAPALQTPNAINLTLEEWPSAPFTHKIADHLCITVDKVGPPVNPEANKDIFNSLNIIHWSIATGGEPTDEIDLPFYRTNQRVSIRFGGGLESTLPRLQMAQIMLALWRMMIDQGPREIIWAKIVIDKVPIVDFSLIFRW